MTAPRRDRRRWSDVGLSAGVIALLLPLLTGCTLRGRSPPRDPSDPAKDVSTRTSTSTDTATSTTTSTVTSTSTSTATATSTSTGTETSTRAPSGATAETPGTPPRLSRLEAWQSGRDGRTLLLRFDGADDDADVVGVRLTLRRSDGLSMLIVPSKPLGRADTDTLTLPLDATILGSAVFAGASASMDDLDPASFPGSVEAALVDSAQQESGVLSAVVTLQATKDVDEPCVVDHLGSRCAAGLSCAGEPPRCRDGSAPTLQRLVFAKEGSGRCTSDGSCAQPGFACDTAGNCVRPVLRWDVVDPDDDLESLELRYEGPNGGAPTCDADDPLGSPPSTSGATLDVRGDCQSGRCRGGDGLSPSQEWLACVPVLVATPIDSRGISGTAVKAPIKPVPSLGAGTVCEPRVDRCAPGLGCVPGADGNRRCLALTTARQQRCLAAPMLSATGRARLAPLRTDPSALWTPPPTCGLFDELPRTEAVVRIDVARAVSALEITTDLPGTASDTALWLIAGNCQAAAASTTAVACNDNDEAGGTLGSRLKTGPLAAGTYLLVISSAAPPGSGAVATRPQRVLVQVER